MSEKMELHGPNQFQRGFTGPDCAEVKSVRGLRAWNLGFAGLVGYCAYGIIPHWRSGENIAKCLKFSDPRLKTTTPPHSVASPDCTCGFYAYFTDNICELKIRGEEQVLGVIEGYGPTTIGSEGFRSTKAKILALTRVQISRDGHWGIDPLRVSRPTALGYFNYKPYPLEPDHWIYQMYPEACIFPDWDSMLAEFPVGRASDWRNTVEQAN